MTTTNLAARICDDLHADKLNVAYDLRFVLVLLTTLLSPCYALLSMVAVASRCNSILKAFASHGKTSTTDVVADPNYDGNCASSSSPFGLTRWQVSKQCFVHFYLVGLVSTAFTAIYHIDSYCSRTRHRFIDTQAVDEMNFTRTVAVVVLVIHIARRAYECLYVQQYRNESSKMHFMAYALGLGHYAVLPLVFWDIEASSDAILSNVNVTNGVNSFGSKIIYSATKMNPSERVFIFAMTGILLWLQYEQHKHHVILADIRRVHLKEKKRDDDPSRNRYYSLPPYKRWFRYTLSPHYLAEILLYLSFAILLEMASAATIENTAECQIFRGNNYENLTISRTIFNYFLQGTRYRHWALFGWVTSNLTVSAMNSYDWYNSQYNNFITKSDDPNTDTSSYRASGNRNKRRALLPKIL